MRESLSKYNMHNAPGADIHGAHVPEAELKRLAQMVETVNNIHSRALRMDGANAAGLATASVERLAFNNPHAFSISTLSACLFHVMLPAKLAVHHQLHHDSGVRSICMLISSGDFCVLRFVPVGG